MVLQTEELFEYFSKQKQRIDELQDTGKIIGAYTEFLYMKQAVGNVENLYDLVADSDMEEVTGILPTHRNIIYVRLERSKLLDSFEPMVKLADYIQRKENEIEEDMIAAMDSTWIYKWGNPKDDDLLHGIIAGQGIMACRIDDTLHSAKLVIKGGYEGLSVGFIDYRREHMQGSLDRKLQEYTDNIGVYVIGTNATSDVETIFTLAGAKYLKTYEILTCHDLKIGEGHKYPIQI